jgi:hypothetical protein
MGETDSADKLHGFGRGVFQHLFELKQWEEKGMNYKSSATSYLSKPMVKMSQLKS